MSIEIIVANCSFCTLLPATTNVVLLGMHINVTFALQYYNTKGIGQLVSVHQDSAPRGPERSDVYC